MRDKTKFILFIGIICCAVGGILIGVGALFGGKTYVMHADLNHLNGSATNRRSDDFLRREQKQLSELKGVKMNVNFEDIRIESSEDENFYLSYPVWQGKDGEEAVSYEVKNGILNLKEKEGMTHDVYINVDIFDVLDGDENLDEEDFKIILYIPKDKVLDSFAIQSNMGDLEIDTVNTKKIDIHLSSGDMDVSNLLADGGKIEAQDGEIEIKKSNLANVEFNSRMGDVLIKDLTWNEGSISMGDGDMEITDSNLQNIKFDSSMGDLELQDVVWNTGDISTADGNIKAKQWKPIGKIKIESAMGDINIHIDDSSFDTVSYDVQTYNGMIYVSDKLDGKLREDDYTAKFSKSADKEKAKLSIESNDGDITIK